MKVIGMKLVGIWLALSEGLLVRAKVEGDVRQYELRQVDGMWGLFGPEFGILRHRFDVRDIEHVDKGTIKFGERKERIDAVIVKTRKVEGWLTTVLYGREVRLLPVAVAEKLGWTEARPDLTVIHNEESNGDYVIRVRNGVLYYEHYEHEEDDRLMLCEDTRPASPHLCNILFGFEFAEVRFHGVEVVCGHESAVLADCDANTVWCKDGYADVCMDCWCKLPEELVGEGDEHSDCVFLGTKEELREAVTK